MGSSEQSFVNDRFFVYNTGGYQNLGHTEPSLRPSTNLDSEKAKKEEREALDRGLHRVVMGDDMGCSRFAYLGGRLDFLNVPYLADAGVRVYSQAELIYYPEHKRQENSQSAVWKDIRGTVGFGIAMPLSDMINFGLYYNAANFGSKVGDIEKSSLINFTFNFF